MIVALLRAPVLLLKLDDALEGERPIRTRGRGLLCVEYVKNLVHPSWVLMLVSAG